MSEIEILLREREDLTRRIIEIDRLLHEAGFDVKTLSLFKVRVRNVYCISLFLDSLNAGRDLSNEAEAQEKIFTSVKILVVWNEMSHFSQGFQMSMAQEKP